MCVNLVKSCLISDLNTHSTIQRSSTMFSLTSLPSISACIYTHNKDHTVSHSVTQCHQANLRIVTMKLGHRIQTHHLCLLSLKQLLKQRSKSNQNDNCQTNHTQSNITDLCRAVKQCVGVCSPTCSTQCVSMDTLASATSTERVTIVIWEARKGIR